MDWPAFRASLFAEYHEEPQKTAKIDHALRLCREGLELLASLGHQAHLRLGPAPPAGWPRKMFHLKAAPRGHQVFCQEDIELLGEGWFPTLDEAKHAAGMERQFRRGGILPKRGLPAPSLASVPTKLDQERNYENGEMK